MHTGTDLIMTSIKPQQPERHAAAPKK
jgi:hypothetical protein